MITFPTKTSVVSKDLTFEDKAKAKDLTSERVQGLVQENKKLRKCNSTVARVHAINTLLNSVKAINAMKVLFNIVAVLLV